MRLDLTPIKHETLAYLEHFRRLSVITHIILQMKSTSCRRCHLPVRLNARPKQEQTAATVTGRTANSQQTARSRKMQLIWCSSAHSSASVVCLIGTDCPVERRGAERRPDHAMRCPQWATGTRSAATNITTENFTEETPTPNGLR